MKNIELLQDSFIGGGEVLGFQFNKILQSENAYIYKVTGGNVYFEVFKRLNAAKCIDFKKRIYSETEFKEYYPKSNAFGFTAWTFYSSEDAVSKFNLISKEIKE